MDVLREHDRLARGRGVIQTFFSVLDETHAGLDGWFPEIPVEEEGSQTVVKLPRGRPDVSDVQS